MTRKTIGRWLISGSSTERFWKEALVMFPIAFCSYCVFSWRDVVAHHFLVENLWVTAACYAFVYGIFAAMNALKKPNNGSRSSESALDGVSSE